MKSSSYSACAVVFVICVFRLCDKTYAQNYYPFRFGFGNTSMAMVPVFSIDPSVRIDDNWFVGTKIEGFFQAGEEVTQLPIMDSFILLMGHT
ncbi:MAG: hypothetical protein ORN54_02515 [Cyclobacteriaceae bacterium]|nr:hypothetical protein [Cyclobacteriaceae bacterium]